MNKDLKDIHGVGPKILRSFRYKGIWNTYDLISYVPKSYEDFVVQNLKDLKHGDEVTLQGYIADAPKRFKKQVVVLKYPLKVENSIVELTIFGRPYLEKELQVNQMVLVKGKYNFFKNELLVSFITKDIKTPILKPIYQIDELHDKVVSNIIQTIFDEQVVDIFETLPDEIIQKYQLIQRKEAYYHLHFPSSMEMLKKAQYRFKVEEAFFHSLKYLHQLTPKHPRKSIEYQIQWIKEMIGRIPYQLTLDQQEAVNDIFRDFKQEVSMYRLIQGDVGTGKTNVAFIGMLGMINAGYQSALMAPTEILAKQHYENFTKLYPDILSVFITSQSKQKDQILKDIQTGVYKVIFGTHILGLSVEFSNLGLVIIDEQHKFGVEIRDQLIKKSVTKDTLYLTATPIPRSLSLSYFGDLEISNIKQKPKHKLPIQTMIFYDEPIDEIIKLIKESQSINEQTFIVTPLIEQGLKGPSIESMLDILRNELEHEHLYVIHGRLDSSEVDTILAEFILNPKGVLLATTMIEVGIDVPNATKIFIMGANNFGLSQLHQLRGRVGRGKKLGKCYLVTDKSDHDRLEFLVSTEDGFLLSEYDLKLRGPGIFSSFIQSGQTKYQFIDMIQDLDILKRVRKDAARYAKQLEKYPYLKNRINKLVI
ncbi:ATP-dependent DNA helicase recG [Acholeplasma oculi]|uniref:ATP-dependent DNA helicase RecG n=1 Tax=Acholeplasma oculi TaxID=35623 RepID=A0A061AD10_9MOLU|nr:ATP-dependent DNA helicase RecG [Acholeplasma oculi]CDR31309.1 ATP-dependent DNA helicase RecG [Acholeplasma oculi]SKC38919.1 ATP-dependent DNA helicase RecG [Acholeplasma oculi]SUT91569.1 ATP-dependent DNA helicase recG [Acholeplasma oculi]